MKKTKQDYERVLEQLSDGVKERVKGNKMWKMCEKEKDNSKNPNRDSHLP